MMFFFKQLYFFGLCDLWDTNEMTWSIVVDYIAN